MKPSRVPSFDLDLDVDLNLNLDVDLNLNLDLDVDLDLDMGGARNFREYPVWQEAVAFATSVYEVTGKMPWFEKKGLCDQLQRAAVSISSNIAEGAARSSDADFAHFLDFALGSAFEVETQLTIAKNVGYFDILDDNLDVKYQTLMDRIHSIERPLNALIGSISYRQG